MKKSLWVIVLIVISIPAVCQVNLSNGLLAYYPFNGNANDASGNGFHGTTQNSPSLVNDRNNIANSAYFFNGSNQYIRIGDILDSVFSRVPSASFSISGWAKTNSLTAVQGGGIIVAKSAGSMGPDQWLIDHDKDGRVKGLVKSTILTDYVEWKSDAVIPNGQWFSYVLTFNGAISVSDCRVQLYVNGVPAVFSRRNGNFGSTCVNTSQEITIGAGHSANSPTTPNNQYNGSVDEVRIYNRVLNVGEIAALSAVTNVNLSNGLMAYYPFTGNADDASGNNFHGSLQSNPSPTLDKNSIPNTAYLFNGSNQYVRIGDILDTIFCKSPKATFSVTGWAKSGTLTNVQGGGIIVAKSAGANGPDQWLIDHDVDGKVKGLVKSSPLTDYVEWRTDVAVPPGQWFHYVLTFNGAVSSSDSRVQFYVNGIPAVFSRRNGSFGTLCANTNQEVTIGAGHTANNPSNPNNQYNGAIDEVRIYNRVLNFAEIDSLLRVFAPPGVFEVKPFSVTPVCAGDTIWLKYSNTGKRFNAGCTYTAQCSDNNNSFSAPVYIGSKVGASVYSIGLDSMMVIIPRSLVGGNYNIRVVTDLPADTSLSATLAVNAKPIASFQSLTDGQCLTGNQFAFNNTSSIGSGSITTYNWEFSDGNGSSQASPSKSFVTAGVYSVNLIAISDLGCKDNIIKTVNVYPQPMADFTVNTSGQCLNANSFAFASTSTVSNGSIAVNNWDFGDGNNSAQNTPTQSYANAGAYIVMLTSTSDHGCKDSTSKTVSVYPHPTTDFSINNATQCFNGNGFSFTDNSSLSQGVIAAYQWDFGDGNTTATQNVNSKTYAAAGSYSVQLLVTSNQGCQGSLTKGILVKPNPGKPVVTQNQFTLTTTAGTGSLQWYKDGVMINGAISSSYNVTQNGSYTVEETLNGCSNISDPILVQNVGIGTAKEQNWLVYPNPSFNGQFTVVIPSNNNKEIVNFVVYDCQGRKVRQGVATGSSFSLDLGFTARGIYLLEVSSGKIRQIVRLVH